MTAHNRDCEDYNGFFHAATGGDGQCVCETSQDDIVRMYRDVVSPGGDDDLLLAAEELGVSCPWYEGDL